MTDAGFTDPLAIPYNSDGSAVTIANDYTSIFTHLYPTDCPVTLCGIRLDPSNCDTPLPEQTNVLIDSG